MLREGQIVNYVVWSYSLFVYSIPLVVSIAYVLRLIQKPELMRLCYLRKLIYLSSNMIDSVAL